MGKSGLLSRISDGVSNLPGLGNGLDTGGMLADGFPAGAMNFPKGISAARKKKSKQKRKQAKKDRKKGRRK